MPLNVDDLVNGDVTVSGSFSYTSAAWASVARELNAGRLDLGGLVTQRFALDDHAAAIDALRNPTGIRGKVLMEIRQGKQRPRPDSGSEMKGHQRRAQTLRDQGASRATVPFAAVGMASHESPSLKEDVSVLALEAVTRCLGGATQTNGGANGHRYFRGVRDRPEASRSET